MGTSKYTRGAKHIEALSETVKEMMRYVMEANMEGMNVGKTELTNLAFGEGNYAYGIGVINALIMTGYLVETEGETNRHIAVTLKGQLYATQ